MAIVEKQALANSKKGHLKFSWIGIDAAVHIICNERRYDCRYMTAGKHMCIYTGVQLNKPVYKRENRFTSTTFSYIGWWWPCKSPYKREYWKRVEKNSGWFTPCQPMSALVVVIQSDAG